MYFAHELKKARRKMSFTQRELGVKVGVDQSRISSYESGEYVPSDIAASISRVLKSPRLRLALSSEVGADIVNIPPLMNVNEDVVNVLDVVIEEAEEVIIAGKRLKKMIRNKSSRLDFTEIEFDEVLELEEQIADLIPCVKLHFIRMVEVFDLDLTRVEKRMKSKLKRKKLIN